MNLEYIEQGFTLSSNTIELLRYTGSRTSDWRKEGDVQYLLETVMRKKKIKTSSQISHTRKKKKKKIIKGSKEIRNRKKR